MEPPVGEAASFSAGELQTAVTAAFARPAPSITFATCSSFRPRAKEHPFVGGKDRTATLEAVIGGEQVACGMVAVGIGNATVVDWCAAHLLSHLVQIAGDDPSSPSLANAGQRAIEFAHREATARGVGSGCMLTLCALNRTRLEVITCQVGVTSAILVSRGRQAAPKLTEDHLLATSANEQRRVKEMGVHLAPALDAHNAPRGPLRAWPGGLTCARVIGNLGPDAPMAVSPIPSCSIVMVPPAGGDLLICSQGVWGELLESHVASLVRASPAADTAARLIVESAAAQHTSYYQEGYGVPLDDATCLLLRVGPTTARAPWRPLSDAKSAGVLRPSAFLRWRQKLFPATPTASTPGCSTPSELSDASIRGGAIIGRPGSEVSEESAPGIPEDIPDLQMEDQVVHDLVEPLMQQLHLGDGSEINVIRLIGEGSSSQVWEAVWGSTPVAVKVLGKQKGAQSRFTNEVAIWRDLSHPCVCPLLHTGFFDSRPWMAFEHMALGSLHNLLHGEQTDVLEDSLLTRIVAQVASGVSYLHRSGVIHRDIKTANVLINEALEAKVGDFGLSTRSGRAEYTAERGTYRQMAPEIVLRRPYDHKCDVYSYGVLLWETLHGQEPFADLMPLQAAFAAAMHQTRPTINLRPELECYSGLISAVSAPPSALPHPNPPPPSRESSAHLCAALIAVCVCQCWDADPANRPEMDLVEQTTAQFQADIQ